MTSSLVAGSAVSRREVVIDDGLSLADLLAVAVGRAQVALGVDARQRMAASSRLLMRWLEGDRYVYGASSGVGDLRGHEIDASDGDRLQANIVRSHCCGVGPPLDTSVVRAALVLRTAVFARGYSAVRPELAALMAEMLNRSVHPIVPSIGSVGASGDPVLLAHVGLAMVGEGLVRVGAGPTVPAAEGLAAVGLRPVRLRPREGLAIVNGLDFTLGLAALVVTRADMLLRWADAIAALALEAATGSLEPFDERVQHIRGPGGHRRVAAGLRERCAGSRLARTEAGPQDPYCLRCIPQVHGASADVVAAALDMLDSELQGVVDNPLILADESVLRHCGHFHGQRLAMAADHLALALCNLANISLNRTSLLLRGFRGLPKMLCRSPGFESGLMMVETTGGAIVGRMRAAAAPASVHSLSVSAEQEDHVSMSFEGWMRCSSLLDRLGDLLAIELLTAATAATWRGRQLLGAGTAPVAALHPEHVDPVDRPLAPELARLAELLRFDPPAGCDVAHRS
jgi:histidine ammonia-lyase